MPRFFLPQSTYSEIEPASCRFLTITGEDAFHIASVLRMREGDEVTVCAPDSTEFLCRIDSISQRKREAEVLLSVQSSKMSENEPKCRIRVFQGMPKGKKTDSIVQKCTELGASEILFVYSDRSVPEPGDSAEMEKKRSRLQKIADEAAKQCQRGRLVSVSILPSFDAALEEMKKSEVSFACYEAEREGSVKSVLRKEFSDISFFIGPEGGLSDRECALFCSAKIPSVTLGKRILRTETAASAVLSMLLYEKEL